MAVPLPTPTPETSIVTDARLEDLTDALLADPTSAPALRVSAAIAVSPTQGSSVGNATIDQATGAVSLTLSTPWGIRADGTTYYDPAGAVASEAAVLDINPTTGAPRLSKIAS